MGKSMRLQDMKFRQWALVYLVSVVFSVLFRVLARHWSWPLMSLPIDFWKGFLLTLATILPAAIVGASVCAGGIVKSAKPKA